MSSTYALGSADREKLAERIHLFGAAGVAMRVGVTVEEVHAARDGLAIPRSAVEMLGWWISQRRCGR